MKNKYKAVRTNGYASKFEARVAAEVQAWAVTAGFAVIEQHPIKFACGARYVCDFVASRGNSRFYIEAKGKETPVWKLKLRMLKHEFPEIFDKLIVVFNRNKRKKCTKLFGGWVNDRKTL